MAEKAGNWPCVTLVTLLLVGFVKLSTGKVCLVSYNSTDPSGYYQFSDWYPTKKSPRLAGHLGLKPPAAACGALCASSPYGFYTHLIYDGYDNLCYCLTSDPDYTKPIYTGNFYYAKKCPKVKSLPRPPSPPPVIGPPPPSPPPPFTPKNCNVPYNSSDPTGYYYFIYFNPDAHGTYAFEVNATIGISVWPLYSQRCAYLCKKYEWGFFVTEEKYTYDTVCYCLLSPLTYKQGGNGYNVKYYSKSCPSGKESHPPGVGHHPPGVGHHPPSVGHHPPSVGHHPPGH